MSEDISPFERRHLSPLWSTKSKVAILAHLVDACVTLDIAEPKSSWDQCCKALDTYHSKKFGVPLARYLEWRTLKTRCHHIWAQMFRIGWYPRWKSMLSTSCQLTDTDVSSTIIQYTQVNRSTIYMDYSTADGHGLDVFTEKRLNASLDALTPSYIAQLLASGVVQVCWLLSTNPTLSLPNAGHWICILANFNEKATGKFGINFFDSSGAKSLGDCENVFKFIGKRLAAAFPDTPIPLRRIINYPALQRSGAPYSCGLFVAHFVVSMMKPSTTMVDIIKDDGMDDSNIDIKCRPFYFPKQ